VRFGTAATLGGMPQEGHEVAWVLGGGGLRGAAEVGMAKALAAHGRQPDLIVGTSIGALNGAVLAAGPIERTVPVLAEMWEQMRAGAVFGESIVKRLRHLLDHWTHFHSNEPLRKLVDRWVPYAQLEEAYVTVETCAACIETSSEYWFTDGPVEEAVLASCALPGVLPPVEVAGRHYVDGGVVNSIPVSRAIELGATEVFVLHVGNIDAPLEAPRHPWDVAMVSFELARRHRFHRELEIAGEDVRVHVLPTGRSPGRYNDVNKLRYNHDRLIRAQVDAAERATLAYLDDLARGL
jgi:NTE family protein